MASIKYKKASYRTHGDLPTIGSSAPDVSLVNTELQNVTFSNWLGSRKLVNIVISVDTDSGAKSVREFDRLAADMDNVAMLMVSYDLPFAHQRLGEQHDLKHVVGLSAIRHAGFGENYGVQIVDGPLAGMFAPAVVVLDENNTIVHVEQMEDITAEPNYRAAMRALGVELDD